VKWSALPREKAVCALCGSDSPILLKRSAGWPVSKCPVCGLIYLSERPTEASLVSIYSNEYYDRAEVGYGGYVKNFGKYRGIFEGLSGQGKTASNGSGAPAVFSNSAVPTASSSTISAGGATACPASR